VPERFDTIIVGGGSAGCVLANRLSQDAECSVLLLESGSTPVSDEVLVERVAGEPMRHYRFGRGLGGSSAINAMIATPGPADDYDRWERDLGCPGWSWSALAPAVARVRIPSTVARPDEWGTVDRAFVEATTELGPPAASAALTRIDGHRVSAADAYLRPVRDRRNLTIRSDALVTRIAIDGRRAIGVIGAEGDLVEAADVIVCAGALNTPLLLHDSGIDLPGIGVGLKDHPSSMITLNLRQRARAGGLLAATLLQWSSSIGVDDLQILPINHTATAAHGGLIAAAMSVRSTGSVSRETAGATTVVRFNMLSDEQDRLRMREATRHMARLVAHESFTAIASGAYIDDIGTPVAALAEDDVGLDHWIAAGTGGYFHASCSCRMGPPDDPMSVVDGQGRVHGYTGLRLCDASILPDIPRANTYLPVVIVAEQIAELIRRSA